jgi:hypothetical protein
MATTASNTTTSADTSSNDITPIGSIFTTANVMMTTPYAGGDWETNWVSTMSDEQRALYNQLVANAGSGEASQASVQGSLDSESLSIAGLDSYNTSAAIKSYESFLDTQVNEEKVQAEIDLAKKEAESAIGEVSAGFAGKGLSSSASNRMAGKVESDLGTQIANIRANALEAAEARKLEATQGLGTLESTYSAQELERLIANQGVSADLAKTEYTTQNEVAMLNAQLGNEYSTAEMQYLLGLINAQTGENISTQTSDQSLHSDLWSNISSLWS